MDSFVNVDRHGRMVMPKPIRDAVKAHRFSVKLEDGEKIVFIPVKSTDEMFGSMPGLDVEGFHKEHARER